MNQNLDILLRLKDMASAPINAVQRSLANFSKSANIAKTKAEEVQQKFEGLGTVGRTVAVGAGVVAGALGFMGKSMLSASGQMEQTRVAFETMLGSGEKAKTLVEDLKTLSLKTPFEFKDVTEYAKRLMAMGISAEEVTDQVRVLGDISAGVGMDKMPQLVLAFGQVRTAGRLTGNELRQFTEAGVPLLEMLSKQFNKSTAEVQKMVSEGQVGFPEVQKALSELTAEGGKFNNLMSKQSETLGGVISNLKDRVFQLSASFGDALLPVVKPIISAFSTLFKILGDLPQPIKTTIAVIGGFVFVVASLATALGAVAFVLPTIATGLALLGVSVKGLLVGTGIGALVVAFGSLTYAIYSNFDTVKKWGYGIVSFFSGAAISILKTLDGLIKKFNEFTKNIPLIPKINIDFSDAIKSLEKYRSEYNKLSSNIEKPKKPKEQQPQQTITQKTIESITTTTENKQKFTTEQPKDQEIDLEKQKQKELEAIRKQAIDTQFAEENQKLAVKKSNLQLSLDQEREYIANRLATEGLDEQQRAEIRQRLNQLDIEIAQQRLERDQYLWSEEQRIMFEREQLKMKGINTELQITKLILDSSRKAGNELVSIDRQIAQSGLDWVKKEAIASVDAMASKWAMEGTAKIFSNPFDIGGYGLVALAAGASAGIRSSMNSIQLAEGGIVLPQQGGVSATVAEAGQAEAVIPLGSNEAQSMLGGQSEQRVIILDADGVTQLATGISKKIDYLKKRGQLGTGL